MSAESGATGPGPRSTEFWDRHYAAGGTSGTGSRGRLAEFKAEVVNHVIQERGVASVIELGCGDGRQLGRIVCRQYIGLDPSPTAVALCQQAHGDDPSKRFDMYQPLDAGGSLPGAEMAISLDVIYHLLEEAVYERYMTDLFAAAARLVLIYSSDSDEESPWDEVRHWRFTNWVHRRQPHWRLIKRVPQKYPYVEGDPDTSWSSFFLYARTEAPVAAASG